MTAAIRLTVLLVAVCGLTALVGCEPIPRDAGPSTLSARLTADQRAELQRTIILPEWPESISAEGAPLALTLDTLRKVNIYVAADDSSDLPVRLEVRIADRLLGTARGTRLSYEVLDFYGRRVASADLGEPAMPPRGSLVCPIVLEGLEEPGAYLVVARLTWATGEVVACRPFAIVPPPEPGLVPDSRFHTDDPAGALVGCKVIYVKDLVARGEGVTNWQERTPERQWQPRVDASAIAARVREFEAAGLTVIGHLGPGHDAEAQPLPGGGTAFGLPQCPEEFAAYTAPIVAALPTVARWDILPEPLERLGSSSADLLRHLDIETRAILSHRGDLVDGLWVSGTPQLVNDFLTLRGVSARGRDARFTDVGGDPSFAAWVAARAGADKWTVRLGEMTVVESPQRRAWMLARTVVSVLAVGGNVELPVSTVRDPAPAAVMAALARRLEGATFHGDVWPGLDLVRSPVFGLRGRRSVAVLWSRVTEDGTPFGTPCRGMIEIPDARHIDAADCLGSRLGLWRERSLLVPLGPAPIYITSDRLSASDLVRRLRQARVAGIAPVAVRVGTITAPVGPRVTVPVYVRGLTGGVHRTAVTVTGPRGWIPVGRTKTVRAEPGRESRVEFSFKKAARNVDNAHPVTIRAAVGDWTAEQAAVAHQVVAPEVQIVVDGRLDEWAAAPVLTARLPSPESDQRAAAVHVNQPTGSPVAEMRLAHDRDYLYVAVRVPLAGARLARSRTVAPTTDPGGTPWGEGTVQLAFGPQGAADPSHVVALVPTARRPAVVRMLAPGMDLRNPVADLADPLWGEVSGARVAIVDTDGQAVYEAAIPREALKELPWSRGSRWRFSFLVAAAGGEVQWPADADGFHWQWSRRTFFPIGQPHRSLAAELGLVRAAGADR